MCNITVGSKVICIQGSQGFPVLGLTYTVSAIEHTESDGTYIGLAEDPNNDLEFPGWCIERFVLASTENKTVDETNEQTNTTQRRLKDLLKEKLNPTTVGNNGTMVVNNSGGMKADGGKIDYTYLLKDLPVSVDEVTKVLMYGAKKYNRSNYAKVESERYHAAMSRHIMAYLRGEKNDPETGYHHLAHAVCCLMFLIEREVKKENNNGC